MMDEDGQFDPMAGSNRKGGLLGKVMGGSDAIFHGMGIDPRRLTPLPKIMILGGAGAAGGGAMAGAPFLAGAGGVSAAAGLLPYLMSGHAQGANGAASGPLRVGRPQAQFVSAWGRRGRRYPSRLAQLAVDACSCRRRPILRVSPSLRPLRITIGVARPLREREIAEARLKEVKHGYA